MIYGIGVDIIEVDRFNDLINNEAFLSKIYTEKEMEEFSGNIYKLAANFSVKEAVSKVLGEGFGIINPKEIEVLRNDKGAPYIILYGDTKKMFLAVNISKIHVSISDTNNIIIAYVVGEME